MRNKLLAAVAAASLLSAPLMAAGSASKLSLGSDVRAGKTLSNVSDQDAAGNSGLFIAAGAAAAVILAVVLISGGDDEDDLPTSP